MIYCNINGRKYKCLMCKDYMTFIDLLDKDSFITIENVRKLSSVIGNPFFSRTVYN